jgi:5-methylcytosine-specific restriction protein A
VVCGFDFEERYGPRGTGYIEVHHLVPLSKLEGATSVDPTSDLRPVCANCHAMIHRGELLTPEQLRDLLR